MPKNLPYTYEEKPNFEDVYSIINETINKKRYKWQYPISYMDFDDVKSIIITHIYNKWEQYNHKKSLVSWVNKIVHNQLINIARDYYNIYLPPCCNCPFNTGGDGCSLYGVQSSQCVKYKNWESKKKSGLNINLPVALEFHSHEINNKEMFDINFDDQILKIKGKAKLVLTKLEYTVFDKLFLEKHSEKEIAIMLKFKNKVVNGKIHNEQIERLKESIYKKIQKLILEE
jgi:hypothetical protein